MQTADQMTDADLTEFARTYFAAHPDANSHDVFAAIRASGYTGVLQHFQVHDACARVRPIPTLTTVDDAVTMLRSLAEGYDHVSVFWDRGWGDSGEAAKISITVDGNGQMPLAWIADDVYEDLVRDEIVEENNLNTFKARRSHDYMPTRIVG